MAVASTPAIAHASAHERRISFRVGAMMGWWHPQESWDEGCHPKKHKPALEELTANTQDATIRKNLGMRAAICEKQNWRWNELTANTQDATADSSTDAQFNYRYQSRRLHADL
eukprot:CAMPEP_0183599060 /NCGR_PEP_ID=MMETSP0371-20130417/179241_1 /TAXON_ID=268820 /ORGANISM="Peridinium aciculiferum, Strain PAER-2" /LENGTH=112 /DNA_ID=CAMNT_0025811123 /DNA_START=211 /DNA_END=550 /DNA_ORIENTATION=-